MPTYEYICTTCEAPLEVVQSIHESSITDCPSCEDGRLRKIFGNVGVVFKGSGFYRTDSRGKSAATAPATPKADAKETKKSSEPAGTGSSASASGASKGSSDSNSGAQKSAAAAAS